MTKTAAMPAHGQIAEFRVGAILATQAIAVYIDSEGTPGVGRDEGKFAELPERLKIRVLAACEEEFRLRKEDLVRQGMERRDWTVTDLVESRASTG